MNSRLTVAAHVLGIIAYIEREEHRATTSDELAASVGTNPVVVRRVLSQLKAAGLIDCRRGVGGGSILARDPREITMRMVYGAVEERDCELIGRHAGCLGEGCQVAPVMAEYLDELYADAEEALLQTLATVTVDSMSRAVMDRVQRRGALHRPATLQAS